jgi:hypothetical protein
MKHGRALENLGRPAEVEHVAMRLWSRRSAGVNGLPNAKAGFANPDASSGWDIPGPHVAIPGIVDSSYRSPTMR